MLLYCDMTVTLPYCQISTMCHDM